MNKGYLAFRRNDDRKSAVKVVQPSQLLKTKEEILQLFRGADGVPWPNDIESINFTRPEGGLAQNYQQVCRYIDESKKIEAQLELLYVSLTNDNQDASDKEPSGSLIFRGFDILITDFEFSLYSVVLNEVIFGHYPELQKFSPDLNDSLLFKSLQRAKEALNTRNELTQKNADLESVEDGDRLCIVEIWS